MKVSVAMITYNHEKFIAQAIEGVLMQETNFGIELIINEDCSTDGTAAIVADYQRRYPDKIRATIRDKNIGAMSNFIEVLARCTGEYIALCEGDDYWTDPHKLQKQVEVLDSDASLSLCWHVVRMGEEDLGNLKLDPEGSFSSTTTFADVLAGKNPKTCAVLFRNGLISEFPPWYHDLPMGDWPLFLLLTQHGDAYCIPEVMAFHKWHPGGVWSTLSAKAKFDAYMRCYAIFRRAFGNRYKGAIRKGIAFHYHLLSGDFERAGNIGFARLCVLNELIRQPLERHSWEHALRLCCPGAHRLWRKTKQALSKSGVAM